MFSPRFARGSLLLALLGFAAAGITERRRGKELTDDLLTFIRLIKEKRGK